MTILLYMELLKTFACLGEFFTKIGVTRMQTAWIIWCFVCLWPLIYQVGILGTSIGYLVSRVGFCLLASSSSNLRVMLLIPSWF